MSLALMNFSAVEKLLKSWNNSSWSQVQTTRDEVLQVKFKQELMVEKSLNILRQDLIVSSSLLYQSME